MGNEIHWLINGLLQPGWMDNECSGIKYVEQMLPATVHGRLLLGFFFTFPSRFLRFLPFGREIVFLPPRA